MAASRLALAFHLVRCTSTRLCLRPIVSTESKAISRVIVGHLSSETQTYAATDHGGSNSATAAAAQMDNAAAADSTSMKQRPDPYQGISSSPFPPEAVGVLTAPLNEVDIEIKLDGLLFLPEIKYRRVLNKAFGPGGWALMPMGDILHFQNEVEGAQLITREYGLYCNGRFVSQAMGEHTFYSKSNLAYGKACESAKSNALMRCCKDLGIASELWDPRFIKQWKAKYADELWCENVRNRERKKLWRRKDLSDPFPYPWRESGGAKTA